jgi:hypothetical protein
MAVNDHLNRSCERTDILPIYRGYVTRVNLYSGYIPDRQQEI